MNNEINNGGPAFPIGSGDMRDPTGMSLRDYFMAKAFPAIATEMLSRRDEAEVSNFDEAAIHEAVRLSVIAADSMIKAREK